MNRVTRSLLLALGALTLAGPVSAADAPGKVVVIPVVVGRSPDPDVALVAAVAEGLRQNARWTVEYGGKGRPLVPAPASLSPDALSRLGGQLDDAARLMGTPAEALAAAEAIWTEVRTARRNTPLGPEGEALAYRAGALVVAAQAAAGKDEEAGRTAREVALLFPGRTTAAGVPPEAAQRLTAVAVETPDPAKTARIAFLTRPDGCQVLVGGVPVGNSPVSIAALPGATYHAQASCGPEGKAGRSFLRAVVAGKEGESRQEVLDSTFPKAFQNDAGGARVRFASPDERRQLEDGYARRAAEALDADGVVFVSVGELSGTDWLSGRHYLRSGYQNRVGLVRLELPRAAALGAYLATGKEMPGVLRRDEAYQLAVASRSAQNAATASRADRRAWYTDVPGWILTGVGTTGMVLGAWASGKANDKQDQADYADNIEKDAFKSQDLRAEAQTLKFWSGVGLVGGGLMAATGIVLLITPEYSSTRSELIGLGGPPRLTGSDSLTGLKLQLAGRF